MSEGQAISFRNDLKSLGPLLGASFHVPDLQDPDGVALDAGKLVRRVAQEHLKEVRRYSSQAGVLFSKANNL